MWARQEAGPRTANGEETPTEFKGGGDFLMKTLSPAIRPVPLFALVLLSCVLAGCAPKPTIVGKWQGAVAQAGATLNTTMEFTPDGKEKITVQGSGGGGAVDISAAGTYTVSGTDLTQTLTTMTLRGQTLPIPPNQAKHGAFTLDGDRLTLTNPGSNQPLTLTRVK